jgi:hypothetical protein
VVVVEGPDDFLVLDGRLPGADLFPADGKPNVLTCLENLQAWGVKDVHAVIDLDFDDPNDHAHLSHMITPYDFRDLEAMLAGLGVLEHVLNSLGTAAKVAVPGVTGAIVKEITDQLVPVSRLRALNARERLGIPFDEGDLAKKIDKKSLELDFNSYCRSLRSKSQTNRPSDDDHDRCLHDATLDDGKGPRGKDLVAAVGVALRSRIGNLSLAATQETLLCGVLRSSCGERLESSDWIRRLRSKAALSVLSDSAGDK